VGGLQEGFMHYYQFNIGDYASHTSHLDPMEDLAYRRMLDYCYLSEIGLPETVEEIARLIRMRTHTDCIANVLREFFVQGADRYWRNPRVEEEIDAFRQKSKTAAESARKRWDKERANALRTQCEGNAKHKPLNTKHETLNNSPLSAPSADDARFAEWMFSKVLEAVPGSKQPNLTKWANTVRLMRERDNLTHRQMAELFSWVNRHPFWKTNVLSPDKFREKFPQLSAKKTEEETNATHRQPVANTRSARADQALADYFAEIAADAARDAGDGLDGAVQPQAGH
jgi:uncharacterized protein YdaU (DUF1376 family)